MKRRLFILKKRLSKAADWLIAKAIFAVRDLLRLAPPRAGIAFADRVGRVVGPWTPRHKIALDNLRQAFPEKDKAWIEATARANWGQMGRVAAEYVFLDAIFDFDPNADRHGTIEVAGVDIFEELKARKGPFVFFTAHLGCFELLPVCAATYDLQVTALFRQPNNRYIAREVQKARTVAGGHLVPSRAGAAWALASVLDRRPSSAAPAARIHWCPSSLASSIARSTRSARSGCPAGAIAWSSATGSICQRTSKAKSISRPAVNA